MRVVPSLLVAAAVVVGAACSRDLPAQDEVLRPSPACVEAVQRAGLTQETTVREARARIESSYETGAPMPKEERAFWDAHLDRLDDLAEDEPIGEALNGIPCTL